MTRTILLSLFVVMLLAACKDGDSRFTREGELRIVRGEETITRLAIEIADDQEQRTHGLMYREHLAENHGMLFIFDDETPRRFWMKNTPISLDIIFIGSDGEILHIAQNTTPYSRRGVACSQPALYVLEVNGGYCEANGVVAGDRIIWSRD